MAPRKIQKGSDSQELNCCDVLVLGAGVSGLSTAWHLRDGDLSIVVLEAADRPFGHSKSHEQYGLYWDEGPHVSFTRNPYVRDFVSQSAGELNAFTPTVSCAFNSEWITHPVQHHLDELPLVDQNRILADLDAVSPSEHEVPIRGDYREWLIRQFGQHMYEVLFAPYTRKYWAAEPAELSSDWLGARISPPRDFRIPQTNSSPRHYIDKIRYPQNAGFENCYRKLLEGPDVHYSRRVVSIDLREKKVVDNQGTTWGYSTLVSTLPLPVFCSLLPDYDRPDTRGLEWTAIWLSNVLLKSRPKRTETWGYVYDESIAFARFWQPHELSRPTSGNFGIQTETYMRRVIMDSGSLPESPDRQAMEIQSQLVEHLNIDLERLGLVDSNQISQVDHHFVEWGNVLFTLGTASKLDQIWSSLVEFGLHRESEDTRPLSVWDDDGRPASGKSSVGSLVMAGRYAQWKYFWSDDCLLRGRSVAEALKRDAA